MDFDEVIDRIATQAVATSPRHKTPDWTPEELAYLRAHHAEMLDGEIAEALGRSEMAIKVQRVRQGLPAASRAGEWIASHRAARMIGVETHAMTWWCEHGLIPYTMGGLGRQLRLVRLRDLKQFVVNPMNWVYVDWHKINDPHLRRLCELRAERWGDEWWTTRQVADYHGVDVKDVTRLITMTKRIKAFCPPISRGGRHKERRWSPWFVLKSEATRADLIFYRRPGVPGKPRGRTFTPAADTWILRARDVYGFSWARIARSMGGKRRQAPNSWTVKMRYDHLC